MEESTAVQTAPLGSNVLSSVWCLAGDAAARNAVAFVLIATLQSSLQSLQLIDVLTGGFDVVATLVRGWLQIPLLYLAFWTMTEGGRAPLTGSRPWPRFWALAWRLLLMGLPAALVMALGGRQQSLWMLVPIAFTTGLFAFLGTALPDAVAGGGGFRRAFRRGSRTLWPFLKAMAAGPLLGLVGVVSTAVLIGGGVTFGAAYLGLSPTTENGLADWYAAFLATLGTVTSAVLAVLVAAALTHVWRQDPEQAAGNDL